MPAATLRRPSLNACTLFPSKLNVSSCDLCSEARGPGAELKRVGVSSDRFFVKHLLDSSMYVAILEQIAYEPSKIRFVHIYVYMYIYNSQV